MQDLQLPFCVTFIVNIGSAYPAQNDHLLVAGQLIAKVLPHLVAMAPLPAPVDPQLVHLVNQALFSFIAHLEQSKFDQCPKL